MSGKNKAQGNALAQQLPQGDNGANDAHLPCKKNKDPQLLVKVYCDTGGRKYIHASVDAARGTAAAQAKNTQAKTGVADYSYVNAGTYTVKANSVLAPDDKDYFAPDTATATVTLAQGDKKSVDIAVEKKNIVTPKLEMEYKVVLRDRDLAQHQLNTEPKKLYADATYVEVSFSETNKAYPYDNGAKFTCVPANVDVYLDEKCEDKDKLIGDLTKDQLPADTKLKLYLKGKTRGKFTAKLALIDPADAKIRIEDPVEEEMGVVELEMKLHQQDIPTITGLQVQPDVEPIETYHSELKNLELPDQVELSDADKVKTGRLLHAQDGKRFSRAKLLIKKYEQDDWPDGTDNYNIVLKETNTSGATEIHSKEWGKHLKKTVEIKVSDLKKKDHEYWVQGKDATSEINDVRLDLGLDRADGGLAKTVKRNGDWIRFTVVQITEVKVDYVAQPNTAAAWDDGQKRFNINFQADPAGRQLTIGAKLSAKIKDVTIHFMLVPDKKNLKKANWGVDKPDTWVWKDVAAALKHKDKANRTDFLHCSAKTDVDGYAKFDLTLSRFAGDQFEPAAYIEQDPHLAKYVDGHSDLGKKKPVLAGAAITVWHKIWYQLTKPQGFNPADPAAAVAAYKAVYTEVELDQKKDFDQGAAPPQTFYAKYMFEGGSSNDSCANIGDYNKNVLAALLDVKADQPVKRHVMVCLYQYDVRKAGNTQTATGESEPIDSDQAGQWIDIELDKLVVDPAFQGGSMISSLYWYRDSNATHNNIPANSARIPNPRKSNSHIQVQLPAIVPAPDPNDQVYVVAECHAPWGPYLGESFDVRHTLVVYDASDIPDYNDTIVHEFGHSFNQTPRPGTQPGAPNIPDHPQQADQGQGNHCQVNKGTHLMSGKTKYICAMYDSGPMKWGLHKYCKKCHPYLLVEDFHKP